MAESANELNMLQLEFVSQVLDGCARLLGVYDATNKEERGVLDPAVTGKVSGWVRRACELQTKEQAMRARTPLPCAPKSPKSPKSPAKKATVPKNLVFGVPLETLPLVPGFHVPLILFDTTEALRGDPEGLLPHKETLALFS